MKTRGSNGFSYSSIHHHEIFLRPRQRKNYVTSPSDEISSPPILRSRRPHPSFRTTSHTFNFRLRKQAIHKSSSSESSDSTTDDEGYNNKRKSKSINAMAKARSRCLPNNLNGRDILNTALRDRKKIGGVTLADVDPMAIDKSILFDSIGGLDHHVQSLKEMILFPLMYPEVFEKFRIQPPRGVLFHGPPGTGKTLVARALANECSQGERKVSFFMRKGADCLSKWVGESERQLRLLFDQAYTMQPSIIFFDEIDGIAPVRSTRQDQIHSSIVSTLLALMDGLDSRGEIVVIGATNRIDAIDPALRRPGRFDREFYFPSPSFEARQRIFEINTKNWQPPLSLSIIDQLSNLTVGYCGADIKSLCAEAALVALRRRYPQIYSSKKKLLLNVDEISVELDDFLFAMQKIVPAAQRSVSSPARPLNVFIKPLLENKLTQAIELVNTIFHPGLLKKKNSDDFPTVNSSAFPKFTSGVDNVEKIDRNYNPYLIGNYRPRFIIHGKKDQGQSTHLGPAILHNFESISHIKLDLPSLYNVSSRTPEEALANVFFEAEKRLPCIIYLPHINHFWPNLSETLRATFLTILDDLEPTKPLLIVATSDIDFNVLPDDLQEIFSQNGASCQLMEMRKPNEEERRKFFYSIFFDEIFKPPNHELTNQNKQLEELPLAPTPEPRKLTESQMRKLKRREEATLRELRLFLRETLSKLFRDRRFQIFSKPVDTEEVQDYLDVIKEPMDLETMMAKIDTHKYECAASFLEDINLICHNALEYNPVRDTDDKLIRHRACMLRDAAYALIETEMDSDFEEICQEIHRERINRGESPTKTAPSNYCVIPNHIGTSKVKFINKNDNKNDDDDDEDTEIDSANYTQNKNEIDEETEIDSVLSSSNNKQGNNKSKTKSLNDDSTECEESNLLNDGITKNVRVKRKKRRRKSRRWAKKVCAYNQKNVCNGQIVNGKVFDKETLKKDNKNKYQTKNKQSEDDESVQNTANGLDSQTQDILTEEELSTNELNENIELTETNLIDEIDEITQNTENDNELKQKNELIIDKTKVNKLFDRIIDVTKESSVEELEKLHSNLLKITLKRKNEWDKNGLIKEICFEIDDFESKRR